MATLDNVINNILVFNGSPRRSQSNTHFITKAFLEGAEEAGAKSEVIFLYEEKTLPCQGEFHCWLETPGRCMYKDKDSPEKLHKKIRDVDLVIFASPLYADMVSGKMKTFIDRVIPMIDPHIEKDGNPNYVDPSPPGGFASLVEKAAKYVLPFIDPHYQNGVVGEYRHKQRIDENNKKISFPKIGVISNCGLPEQSHFETLKQDFRRMARNLDTEVVAEIYRGGGELLSDDSLLIRPILLNYQRHLKQAGREVARYGRILPETQERIERPLVPHSIYVMLANAMFDRATGKNLDAPLNRAITFYEKITGKPHPLANKK